MNKQLFLSTLLVSFGFCYCAQKPIKTPIMEKLLRFIEEKEASTGQAIEKEEEIVQKSVDGEKVPFLKELEIASKKREQAEGELSEAIKRLEQERERIRVEQGYKGETDRLSLQATHEKLLTNLITRLEEIKKDGEKLGIVFSHWTDFIKLIKEKHSRYLTALIRNNDILKTSYKSNVGVEGSIFQEIEIMKKNLQRLYDLVNFKVFVAVFADIPYKEGQALLEVIESGKISKELLGVWQKKYEFTQDGVAKLKARIDLELKRIAGLSISDLFEQIKKRAGKPVVLEPVVKQFEQNGSITNASLKTLFYFAGTHDQVLNIGRSAEDLRKAFKPLLPKEVADLKFDINTRLYIYMTDKDLAPKGTIATPITPTLKPYDIIYVFQAKQPGMSMYLKAETSLDSGITLKPVDSDKKAINKQATRNITTELLTKEKVKVQDLIDNPR